MHVAYQTSGNTAVWDDDVLRYVEFVIDFNESRGQDATETRQLYAQMREFMTTKQPNQPDTLEIRNIKGIIRKGEAIAGARYAGLPNQQIHFMNLPFYDLAKTQKITNYEADIQQTITLLQQVKPHQVFAAGDFADPHGTHIVCFNIVLEAIKRLRQTEEWALNSWLWLYRGAWHEFETYEIEMAVPLSPQEVERKRNAIFKHQSQKDRPVFPGEDAREFWLRAEERNQKTAEVYDKIGLANYQAMEAFVRWKFE